MGRKDAGFVALSEAERSQLEGWTRRRDTGQALALRARIVLGSAEGSSRSELARQLGVTPQTVSKWRQRFARLRVDGLRDAPRAGAPKRIDDSIMAAVVARTLEKPPLAAHWTTRALAREMDLSQSAISRIWRMAGLRPRHQESFVLSEDPDFGYKLRHMVGIYLHPLTKALALCIDERAPRPPGPPAPFSITPLPVGPLEKKLAPLLAAAPPRARAESRPLLQFLRAMDSHVPENLDILLLVNHSEIYKAPSIYRWLVRHPRVRLRFAPSEAAWRHTAQTCFAALTERHLAHGVPQPFQRLRGAVTLAPLTDDDDPQPFIWLESEKDTRAILARY